MLLHKGHIAEGQGQVFLKNQPVVISGIQPMALWENAVFNLALKSCEVLVFIGRYTAPLFPKYDLLIRKNNGVSLAIPYKSEGFLNFKHIELEIPNSIPYQDSFELSIILNINHNRNHLRVRAWYDFADRRWQLMLWVLITVTFTTTLHLEC